MNCNEFSGLLESITRGNMHHVINKQAVNDEVIALAFHENRLFTINRRVFVFLHPSRNVNVPPSCGLLGVIDAFEK